MSGIPGSKRTVPANELSSFDAKEPTSNRTCLATLFRSLWCCALALTQMP